jgi:hypothetical protein
MFFHSNELGGKNRQTNDFAPPALGKIRENSTLKLLDIALFNFHHIVSYYRVVFFIDSSDTVCL